MQLSEAAEILQVKRRGEDIQFTGCNTDTRRPAKGSLFIALRGENFDGHNFVEQALEDGAVAAMVETDFSGKALPVVVVENTRGAMGKLASAWRKKFSLPVIAVTGSNGKTTVKEMLASILSQQASVLATQGNLNNDIGVPLTLFGLHGEHEFAVIEMGANHPGEIANLSAITRPNIALITLCAPAHIEGFGSIEGVANAKAEIFSSLDPEGIAILNADDAYIDMWLEKVASYKRLTFAIDNKADVGASDIRIVSGSTEFMLRTACAEIPVKLNLPGLHNVRNALAAAACCIAVNIPLAQIRDGLQLMQPVKGRMQSLNGRNNSRIIDDTYNANPASMQAAIDSVMASTTRCWLVMGDMGELGNAAVTAHQQLGESARAAGVERLYALGELARYTVEAFGKGARHFSDRETLINTLALELEKGLTVLVKGSRSMAMEQVVQAMLEEN